MYRNDPRRSQSSNQPWVDPRVGGRRSTTGANTHNEPGPPSGRPVFHVLPPDSRPQQPRHMTDPYGRSSGNEEYLSLLSQYVPAPITNYYTHDPSSYTDYPDSRVDFPLHSEPSSDSEDFLSVPEQGFHKRSYSNETRGRPVRSQSKIPEPRSRSSDVAQPHLHKPGHRTKRALRSSFKEGPSPRMEVAFLPDVTVVNFEGRDVTVSSTSLQPEPPASVLEPQKSQQPHRHDQKNDRAIATTTPTEDAFEHLLQHGCLDLSAHLDLHACSSQALAGGRFGDVWRGSLLNGSQVAIKCLRLHAASHGAKSIKRAARELYIWSKAKHQNVLELMGIAMFKGQLAMISRWMTNGTLSEYAFKNPRVDRWALCLQVTEGLTYMHKMKMVHGDLKAINVLVSDQGIAKLADFGNSILGECSLGFTATTNIGGGTIRWMAPELLGEDSVERSLQADVYALGMTILEVMTGRSPFFEYKNEAAVSLAIIRGKRPSQPEEISSSTRYGDKRWNALLKCWAPEPEDRPTCRSMRDTMATLL